MCYQAYVNGAGLPSLIAEAPDWEPNARGAAWEREPRAGEPAAFLPNLRRHKKSLG